MQVTARLHNFHGHNPHDYVVIVFRQDGTWDRDGSSNFSCPSRGTWAGAMGQETHLRAADNKLLCVLYEFNLKSIWPIPDVDDHGSLTWHSDDHTEVIDGEWIVMEKQR